MYKNIVVPLDGSKLAECVLPHVETIASSCSTEEVTLISVTELLKITEIINDSPMPNSRGWRQLEEVIPGSVPDINIMQGQQGLVTEGGRKFNQAEKYLVKIAQGLQNKGVQAKIEVLTGDPAEEIVSFCEAKKADLIIMASHGHSGILRWTHGSVSEKVFRASKIPILMVRVPGVSG